MNLAPDDCTALLEIARRAIRGVLSGVDAPPLAPASTRLQEPGGCFVSLHEVRTRRLRGCVGRLDAGDVIWLAVHQTAISALSDPRFASLPLAMNDLPTMDLEITLVSKLTAADDVLSFAPLVHGIYLTIEHQSACFLPQVARDTGWTREQLLERLCTEKLGVRADAWRGPDAKLETFTTQIIGPEPFA
ncbi:MAG: AmmeMemoRadiSam system protein A [Tepidisphaeraceae bacterium]